MSNEVSNTRLYLGNLPPNATKADIEAHFATHGTGEITEVKLMHGFGFIEYKDPMDARDVVPAFHGSDFKGTRLTVQFARGPRPREPPGYGGGGGHHDRAAPRPRRTIHRMTITGLPNETSWQLCAERTWFVRLHRLEHCIIKDDTPESPLGLPGFTDRTLRCLGRDTLASLADLKDFARQAGPDVVYSETTRDSGRGFVEFENAGDLRTAVEKLDGYEFKGKVVQCIVDTQTEVPVSRQRGRSRSPGRRPYGGPPFDEHDRRGPPPRGYGPRRDEPQYGYRERSPRRDYYDERAAYHSPPRRPMDDYPPPTGPRGHYDEPYRRDYPPPPPPGPYGGRPYDRPPPPRDFAPREGPPQYPRDGGYGGRDYDRGGRYW
ncbi:hypothetical protein MY3296_010202 [Beauveria thailandica]